MKNKDLIIYGVLILAVILIRVFIATPIRVNGDSMYDTLEDGNIMILKKYDNNIERFDIVVVKLEDEKIIKRVIGLPKEDIEYTDNTLFIDGKEVKDKFAKNNTQNFKDYCGEDEYFVMGDNREVSKDSRIIGCVQKDQIIGKTNYIIFPFNKWGNVE